MINQYRAGANWTSKDGKRNIVIERELEWGRGECFAIRNLATGRVTNIELSGLNSKFRFTGYDPAYEASSNTAVTVFLAGALAGVIAYSVASAASAWRYLREPPAAWTFPPACWPPITPPDPTEEEE